jgi:glutathione reductase (NADPH)
MQYDYDLFVIGAGSGGIATARRAASYGAKVGIAEGDRLGGTCVNRGCVPKKFMVYASRFPSLFEDSQGYGWSAVKSEHNWSMLIDAVDGELTRLNGIYQRMLDNSNVEIFRDVARFVDDHRIAVGDRTITAERILIAVGGEPVKPRILGIEHTITSDDFFHLKEKPQRIVILGGGYIGSEFASLLNGLGCNVTQVIRRDHILHGFDEELCREVQQGMINHGVDIYTNASLIAIEKTAKGTQVTLNSNGVEETVIADAVSLAATGRKPKLHGLGLETVGVKEHGGAIVVDRFHQTNVPHIYAVGDCTDRLNLTPVAINEGRALADTVFGGQPREMAYDNIATAIFTTPEAATVGLTEAEATERHGEDGIQIFRSKFRPMYYAMAGKEEKTLMKLIVDRKTDRVLGAHMVGDSAAEIIQGVAIALKMGATKAQFDATVGIHPSSAEEFVTMR